MTFRDIGGSGDSKHESLTPKLSTDVLAVAIPIWIRCRCSGYWLVGRGNQIFDWTTAPEKQGQQHHGNLHWAVPLL